MNLSEIPTELIRSVLSEIVENKLKTKTHTINLSSASETGESNFGGTVYRVSFSRANTNESGLETTGTLILKIALQNETFRLAINSRKAFLREIFAFEKILPFFREFEQSKGIVEEDGFIKYPKCYRTIDVEHSESVFLEDLSARNFSIIDRYTEDVSAEHVRLVMKTFGKFHAISFALKDQQPEKFKELSNLPERLHGNSDLFAKEYIRKSVKDVLDVISSDEDALLKTRYEKFLEEDPNDVLVECVNPSSAEPATVISHGDAWQNNMMFKYDDDKNLIDISLLDWQNTRHSSPILDLVHFLFSCTTKELRDAHYDDFLKIYHESLSTHILKLGSDPDQLFPYKLMLEHFRKFARFALVMAVQALPIMTNEKGYSIDVDSLAAQYESGVQFEENVFFTGQSREKYKKRMRDVIIDMVRLEYI